METGNVATPFGRRPMTLAHLRRQAVVTEIRQNKVADKWKVFRDVSAAMGLLGIQSTSLAVLNALLSFHPGSELRQNTQLIVFPSNTQLALRAHGMAGATLRRHLAILVEAGLIIRKDSANGKRYARKDEAGKIESAFGFDISPLLARSEELAALAQQVMADRAAFKRARENLTICRRDVRKLIAAAIEERADGDWKSFEDSYAALAKAIPRTPSTSDILTVLTRMNQLREQVLNQLETKRNSREVSSNAAHHEQHIQNSDSEFIHESEQRFEIMQEEKTAKADDRSKRPLKAFPLDLVLKACPTIGDYGPAGDIVNWRDLMSASVAARSALGVSPSAYQSACEAMGQENAAVAIACVLERANFIASPGGYLRDLTRRASRGEFSLGPMLMALLRVNISACGKTG